MREYENRMIAKLAVVLGTYKYSCNCEEDSWFYERDWVKKFTKMLTLHEKNTQEYRIIKFVIDSNVGELVYDMINKSLGYTNFFNHIEEIRETYGI